MKKLLLFFSLALPINQVLSHSTDNYNIKQNDLSLKKYIPKFVQDGLVLLLLKIINMADCIANKLRKVDPSSQSDGLVIITPKDTNFNIKFLNLYQIKKLNDKFVIPEESWEISAELYDKLKKISSSNLEHSFDNGVYSIKLPSNQLFTFNSTVPNVEAVIITQDNFKQIADEAFDTEIDND